MWTAAQIAQGQIKAWVHGPDGITVRTAVGDPALCSKDQLAALIGAELRDDKAMVVVCAGYDGALHQAVPTKLGRADYVASSDPRVAIFAMPQITQASPPDALHAEEATIAGFIAEHPDWDGVLCLIGASTRWVHISAGEVVSIASYMTCEVFELLTRQSSLGEALSGEGLDIDTFGHAVSDAMSRPERLTGSLATVRAAAVLSGAVPASSRAKILGGLIGAELAAARSYWLGQNVALIGEGEMTQCYAAALTGQGAMMQVHSADALALRGLQEAYAKLKQP